MGEGGKDMVVVEEVEGKEGGGEEVEGHNIIN